MYYYRGKIAGLDVFYAFRHEDTASHYGGWLSPCGETECRRLAYGKDVVRIPESDIREWELRWGFADGADTELGLSIYHTCDRLLKDDRCVFHAAAFLWKGRSYLLTASSGTGKSTQLKNWTKMYGDEIHVMNGDKPVLHKTGDGRILVCPSPWKGKEGWGDDSATAPLGGIIFLEQGKENRIRRLVPRESVPLLLSRFLCTAGDRETVLAAAAMEEAMVQAVPVWLLTNLGDRGSTELAYRTLLESRDDKISGV